MFFVISGYLITSLIREEQKRQSFKLVNFYERRARRILPALFFVMALCIPCAWLWLLPHDMNDFSQSVCVHVQHTVLAAIRLFRYSGRSEALLHTWSLAIEEQFYVFFPILLIVLNKKLRSRSGILLLSALGLASLIMAQWSVHRFPAADYFLLPTRGWELLLGAAIALYPDAGLTLRIQLPRFEKEGISLAGLALFFYAICRYSDATPYPSFYTIAPTLGAALIILFATDETSVGRLLGNNLLVGVGLISYSAYLLHQPILAFARRAASADLSSLVVVCLILGTFGIAYISYRFIETPFRYKDAVSRSFIFGFAAIGSVFFICFGAIGDYYGGFPGRLSQEQQAIAAFKNYNIGLLYRQGKCFLNGSDASEQFSQSCALQEPQRGTTVIWGDSHAAALSYGFRRILGDAHVAQYTASGCPPLLDEDFSDRPMCRQINAFAENRISTLRPTRVLLQAGWAHYAIDLVTKGLARTLMKVSAISPMSEIVVVGGTPEWSTSLPEALLPNLLKVDYTYLPTDRFSRLSHENQIISAVANKVGVAFVDPISLMCVNGKCLAVVDKGPPIKLSMWDQDHLTAEGSVYLAKRISSVLKESDRQVQVQTRAEAR